MKIYYFKILLDEVLKRFLFVFLCTKILKFSVVLYISIYKYMMDMHSYLVLH